MAAKKKAGKKAGKKVAKKAVKKAVRTPVKKAAAKKSIKKATKKIVKKATSKIARTPTQKSVKKPVRKIVTKANPKAVAKVTKPAAVPVPTESLVGQPAPDFTMPTGDGQSISLKDFRGQRVLLYFYPKDDTPGCTTQACALRDGESYFADANTVVIGVSKDSVTSHQKFKNKYQLNFLLASDENTGVSEKYGVWKEKNMYGRKYMGIERSTFLIDEKGIVRNEWRKVSVPEHADNVREALDAL